MTEELHFTSARRGLAPGVSGFCTVARTAGLSNALQARLESLSAHELDSRTAQVNQAYTRVSLQGRSWCILSRVCDAGTDYTGRSNLYAHHLALTVAEAPACGPAWLMRQAGVLDTGWAGEPRILQQGRALSVRDAPSGSCQTWQSVTGDAGWAGTLAAFTEANPDGVAWLIHHPDTDVLALFDEALRLLPASHRWLTGFSTLPHPDRERQYAWRACLVGSPTARRAIGQPGALIIDCSKTLPAAPDGPLVEQARSGGAVRPAPVSDKAARRAARPRKRGKQAALAAEPALELMPDDEAESQWGAQRPAGPKVLPRKPLPRTDEPIMPAWVWLLGLIALIGCGVTLFMTLQGSSVPPPPPEKTADQTGKPKRDGSDSNGKVEGTQPQKRKGTPIKTVDKETRVPQGSETKRKATKKPKKEPVTTHVLPKPEYILDYVGIQLRELREDRAGRKRIRAVSVLRVDRILQVYPLSVPKWTYLRVQRVQGEAQTRFSLKGDIGSPKAEFSISLIKKQVCLDFMKVPGPNPGHNDSYRSTLHGLLSNVRIRALGSDGGRLVFLLRPKPVTLQLVKVNDRVKIGFAPLLVSKSLGVKWGAQEDSDWSEPSSLTHLKSDSTAILLSDKLRVLLYLHAFAREGENRVYDRVSVDLKWGPLPLEEAHRQARRYWELADGEYRKLDEDRKVQQKRWDDLRNGITTGDDNERSLRRRLREAAKKQGEAKKLLRKINVAKRTRGVLWHLDKMRNAVLREQLEVLDGKRRETEIVRDSLVAAWKEALDARFTLVDRYGFELLKIRIKLESK